MTDLDAIESLFAAALEQPDDAARATALEAACRGDESLRLHVERLLRAHFRAGNFLESPAVGDTSVHEPADPPAVVGPYRLVEKLGEGGMGEVWVAEQTEPVRRRVALKLIKAGAATREVVARFDAERQALSLMDHPHIARVLDAGAAEGGRPYFVMEIVRGVSVTEFCDVHRLTFGRRLELFIDVCAAVQHAHQKGVIHRDLKPSNVLVALQDGRPVAKVIDFGVAKAVGGRLTDRTLYTRLTQLIGTPLYMSPEQAEMGGHDVDTRSDVYSLGVILYELLTGTTPLDRRRLHAAGFDEMRRLIREEEPPRPSAAPGLAKLCRGELDWIVLKALEKDRSRRYQSAGELGDDVRRHLAGEVVRACPPSRWYGLAKFGRRYRVALAAAAAVFASLLVAVVALALSTARVVRESKEKEEALGKALAAEAGRKEQLWNALYERARAGRFSRKMGQRHDSLAALAEAAAIRPDERLRDEAIAALALPDLRLGPSWRAAPGGNASRFAIGGASRVYVRGAGDGKLSVRRLADDAELMALADAPLNYTHVSLSADERFVLSLSGEQTACVWRVADGKSVLADPPKGCRGHAFSPDGRHVAIGQHNRVLRFDLATGREVNRWDVAAAVHWLDFHPDNVRLAVGYWSGPTAGVYDARDGKLVADLEIGAMSEQVVAWHPDGERLAVAGSTAHIQLWDAGARRRLATSEGHGQHVTRLTFHTDGELLASYSWDGTLRVWDAGTGRQLMQLTGTVTARFGGDGRTLGLAWQGEDARLIEVTPSREYRTLVSGDGAGRSSYFMPAISPDGRLLAVAMSEGTRLWDLATGRALARLPGAFDTAHFDLDPRGPLYVAGGSGLYRWPVARLDPAGQRLRIGPPQQLSELPGAALADGDDGRALGAASQLGGEFALLDLQRGVARKRLGPPGATHAMAYVEALSADGRWAITSGWHADSVQVWDARTGAAAHRWPVPGHTLAAFTPDSRAVVLSSGDEYGFWSVGDWKLIRRLKRDVADHPGRVAFTRDGKLMAMPMAPGVVHLREVATGRTVARLEDPNGDRAVFMTFGPDGTRLVTIAGYARAVHVWDLRLIRRRLKAMGLDWDWPEYPETPAGEAIRPVASVEVDAGERPFFLESPDHEATRARLTAELIFRPDSAVLYFRRGAMNEMLNRPKEVVADFSQALARLGPDDPRRAECLFRRATWAQTQPGWLETAAADLLEVAKLDPGQVPWTHKVPFRYREVARRLLGQPIHLGRATTARALLLVAVERDPYQPEYRQLLAVACFRLGRWAEAQDAVEKNLGEGPPDAADLYLSAMALHHLGDARAAERYRRAVAAHEAEVAGKRSTRLGVLEDLRKSTERRLPR